MILVRASVLLTAFAATALCLFPLRFAWAAANSPAALQAEDARGTVWSGELFGVTWRGMALGDLSIASNAFERPGDVMLTVRSETGPLKTAALPLSSRGNEIVGIAADMSLASIVPGAPANSRIHLSEGSIKLDGDRCVSANGKIATDAIPTQGVPPFDGRLKCQDGSLFVVAASGDGAHQVTIRMGLNQTANPTVTEASPATQLWLAALGIPVAAPGGGQ